MIAHNADIEKPECNGHSPFVLACIHRNVSVIRYLSEMAPVSKIKSTLSLFDSEAKKFLKQHVFWALYQKMHDPIIFLFLLGQREPESMLSVLHRDLLQDIQKVIKEKIFLYVHFL